MYNTIPERKSGHSEESAITMFLLLITHISIVNISCIHEGLL